MSVNLFKKSDNSLTKVAGNVKDNINIISNTADINLNNYTEEGTYKLNFDPSTGFAFTFSNGPSSILPAGGFSLTVLEYGNQWKSQIFTEYGATVQQYVRNFYYNSDSQSVVWTDWAPIFFRYSTTETFTGKYWVDGKQIYSKVINVPAQAAGSKVSIDLANLNISIPISIKGMLKFGANYYVPVSASDEVTNKLNVFVRIQDNKLNINTGAQRAIFDGSFVILEYTKV